MKNGSRNAATQVAANEKAGAGGEAEGARPLAAGSLREQYDHLQEEARGAYERGRAASANWKHDARDHVRQKPIQSLLLAGGIGFLAALLWRRR